MTAARSEASGEPTRANGSAGDDKPAAKPGPSPFRRRKSIDFDSADTALLETEIHSWVESNRPKLGEVMLEIGAVDPDDLIEALQHQRENPTEEGLARLGEVLLQLGKLDEITLAGALARQFGIPLADLRTEKPDPAVTELVGEELARRHSVIPLRQENGRVFMAIADPLNTEAIGELTTRCKRIGLLMGARSDIERLLDESYNPLRQADGLIQAFELSEDDAVRDRNDDDADFSADETAPVVQVVNRVLTQGVRSRASDIHIEPGEDHVRVRFRVDGAMSEALQLPKRMASALASRVKVMAELNIVERRRAQDGQFAVSVDGRPIDIRVSTAATVHGEKVVLRLLDKTKSLISLRDLGMHPQVEVPYMKIVRAPLGMLLCTGPTGSGKTTTLYATLTEINDPSRNVVTIEDPVEYQFDGISQMPVSATGMTFADGLRSILRQDPDVILVGEIRDEDTARIAMQAALTGHFVLSSLHAVDAVAAVHRFTDMGIEPFLVSSALSGVVGQRLLRRICESCSAPYAPTPAEVRIVSENVDAQPKVWVKGTGCNVCHDTGYRGRVGVYELLQITDTVRELIVGRATHHELRATAVAEGMRTMQEQAFGLVVDGVTTVEDVLRSVYAPGVGEPDGERRELPAGKRALPQAPGRLPRGNGVLPGSPGEDRANSDEPSLFEASPSGDLTEVAAEAPSAGGPANGSAGPDGAAAPANGGTPNRADVTP